MKKKLRATMFRNVVLIHILFISISGIDVYGQNLEQRFSQELFSFPREKMTLEDDQLYLFNGRGFASPCEYSLTGITNIRFFPIELWQYRFNLNFIDDLSGITIQDDTPFVWKDWQRIGKGWDPCAANFRPDAPMVVVPQKETWQPNNYYRRGIFHKEINSRWISLRMESWTSVSHVEDEVFIKLKLVNRDSEQLRLTIYPLQMAPGFDKRSNLFNVIKSKEYQIAVSSDIRDYDSKGFHITLAPKSEGEYNFSISVTNTKGKTPDTYQSNIAQKISEGQRATQSVFDLASKNLPIVETDNKLINDLYNRSVLTFLMCRYTRNDYKSNPFYMIGNWPFATTWDNSYASHIMGLLDRDAFKRTIIMHFEDGRMISSYTSCWSDFMLPIIYLHEPFALQNLLETYLEQTGDWSILSEQAGEHTVIQWLKMWVNELRTKYTNQLGLIDVGYSTEKIIEIRTDGYNYAVPIMNLLSIDFYRKVSEWGNHLKDNETVQYLTWAKQLQELTDKYLWNDEIGWYENLYPDGKKSAVWTFHLFDVLNKDYLDGNKRLKMMSHIKDGSFLGEYGFHSISLTDSLHYDKIDCDWGGGGQYAGMPMRIANYLYQVGNDKLGWDILTRYAGYTKHMPYFSQNPETEKAHNDKSSMAYQISATAASEAVLFGLFGLRPTIDDGLIIKPSYHPELGTGRMKNYKFRGKTIDITMYNDYFEVYVDGQHYQRQDYGKQVWVK